MDNLQKSSSYAFGNSAQAGTLSTQRNRVLRNTYWLLALSLIPTVVGAWAGIALGLNQLFAGSPIISLLVFLGGAFAFIYGIERNKNSSIGVALLLGFTFFMGLMLSRLIGFILGFSNGATLIGMAFGGTSIIFGAMASIATFSKRDFSGMSKWLFVGVLVILIAAVANMFLHLPALMLTISVLAIIIFSAYMLYDVQQVVKGGETNYISATLAIYLDLYNVFSNLLVLLGVFGGSRD